MDTSIVTPSTPSPVSASVSSFNALTNNDSVVSGSSVVDDVFYIVQKSAERAFATGCVSLGCAILNHVQAVLTGDLRQVRVVELCICE